MEMSPWNPSEHLTYADKNKLEITYRKTKLENRRNENQIPETLKAFVRVPTFVGKSWKWFALCSYPHTENT